MIVRRKPERRKPGSEQRQEAAEALATAALAFIAADPERLGRFLAMTGIGPDSVREAARAPHFLAGVLDHLAGDEPLLLGFAADRAIDPDQVIRARNTLAGRPWERESP